MTEKDNANIPDSAIQSVTAAVGQAMHRLPFSEVVAATQELQNTTVHIKTIAGNGSELSGMQAGLSESVMHAGSAAVLLSDGRRSLVDYVRRIGGQAPEAEITSDEITKLPEWALLVGDDVAATAASTAENDIAAELKRTLCSVECRRLIHDGSDAAYEAFTRHQPEAVRLSREDFAALSTWERSVVGDDQTAIATDVIMMLHDIAKSGRVYEAMGLGQHEVDHDEALRLLLHDARYAAVRQRLLPSTERLSAEQWKLVQDVLGITFNYPQALQGEAPAAEEADIPPELGRQARAMFVLHAMLDIAGAQGHVQPEGSVTITGPAYRRMCNLNATLLDRDISPAERNNTFLDAELAHFAGLPLPEGIRRDLMRTVARLSCALRTETKEDFVYLAERVDAQPPVVQAVLAVELKRTAASRATLPYYGPALLKALVKKEGIDFALSYFAHILQEAHIADKEARQNGYDGIVTVHLGGLVRAINTGTIDVRRNPIRFRMRDGGLVPVPYEPALGNLDDLPEFSGTEALQGKRIIVVGEGGGSDGVQAAMVGKLAAAKYGCTVAAVVSVRNEARRVEGSGRHIGQTVTQITPDTRPVGDWRFLEDVMIEGDNPAPAYLLNSADPDTVREDIKALLEATGADAIIGVDTGGDSLYRSAHAGFSAHMPTEITPDQDYAVIQALSAVAEDRTDIPVVSMIVAPGVDSPDYAREVLDEIGAGTVPLTQQDVQQVQETYAAWGMDGSGSERGRYGKTPLAWLHALAGRFGTQQLDLPQANVTSSHNPWRAFTAIKPAMANIVAMDMRRHFNAIRRT